MIPSRDNDPLAWAVFIGAGVVGALVGLLLMTMLGLPRP